MDAAPRPPANPRIPGRPLAGTTGYPGLPEPVRGQPRGGAPLAHAVPDLPPLRGQALRCHRGERGQLSVVSQLGDGGCVACREGCVASPDECSGLEVTNSSKSLAPSPSEKPGGPKPPIVMRWRRAPTMGSVMGSDGNWGTWTEAACVTPPPRCPRVQGRREEH